MMVYINALIFRRSNKLMFRNLFFVLAVMLVLNPLLTAADLAVYAGYTISPNPEYADKSMIEFPFAINRDELEFFKPDSADDRFFARIFAQIDIISSQGMVIDSARTYFSVTAQTLEEVHNQKQQIFNSLATTLPAGLYSARLTVIDAVSKNMGEFFFSAITVEPPQKSLSMGGFMTLHGAKYVGDIPETQQTVLYKNGYMTIPNPLSLFTVDDTLLILYGEIYNLSYTANSPGKYQVIATALTSDGEDYQMFGSRVREKPGSSAVFVGEFSIAQWPKGHYQILLETIDLDTQKKDTITLPFHIISPTEIQLAILEQSRSRDITRDANWRDPYDTLSIDTKTNLVKYLLTEEQGKTLAMLNDSGKLIFLNQYWKEHDEIPATEINETRLELIKRYKFSNINFSTNDIKTNGWLTDRGRIYMTYGEWDDHDDVEAPRIGNSFQVWYYNRFEQGYVFVFDDWSGNDDYRLIHSNVNGEIFDKEWDERLKTGYMEILE